MNKEMKKDIKKTFVPPSMVFVSGNNFSQKFLQEFDQEPTLLGFSNKRDSIKKRESFNSFGYRPQTSNQKKNLMTCESNLIQSSPQRSESSRVDGQFVCKYLTPIKKQQFEKLIFEDEVIQRPQRDKITKTQLIEKKKTSKPDYDRTLMNGIYKKMKTEYEDLNKEHKTNSHFFQQNPCCKCPEMVKSFKPSDIFNQKNQSNIKSNTKYQYNYSQKSKQKSIEKGPTIFVDLQSQVNFLKSNNHDLFTKLKKQIEKNKSIQDKLNQLQNQNKNLLQINHQNQKDIEQLKKLLKKFDQDQKKYLAKQWEEFNFVQEILNQKKRSKSKNSTYTHFSDKKISQRSQRSQDFVIQENNKIIQKNSEPILLSQSIALVKQSLPVRPQSYNNFYPSQSKIMKSIQIQSRKKNQTERKRKLSHENNFRNKGKQKMCKQNQKIENFLKNKLSVQKMDDLNKQKKTQNSLRIQKTQKRVN